MTTTKTPSPSTARSRPQTPVSQDVGTDLQFSVDVTSSAETKAALTYAWYVGEELLAEGTDAAYLLHLIADYTGDAQRVTVTVSDGVSTLDVPWTLTVNIIEHANMNVQFEGPQSCSDCHPAALSEIMDSVHYKFEAQLPDDYVRVLEEVGEDEFEWDGETLTGISGKLHKLCAFPHAYAGGNWIGILNAEKQTSGGCGRCHIGNGVPPHTVTGDAEPTADQEGSIDCLICHRH